MNVFHDCKNELLRIGQAVGEVLLKTSGDCQCNSQPAEMAVKTVSTCSCGQDTCQIGNSPNACKPQSQAVIEQA